MRPRESSFSIIFFLVVCAHGGLIAWILSGPRGCQQSLADPLTSPDISISDPPAASPVRLDLTLADRVDPSEPEVFSDNRVGEGVDAPQALPHDPESRLTLPREREAEPEIASTSPPAPEPEVTRPAEPEPREPEPKVVEPAPKIPSEDVRLAEERERRAKEEAEAERKQLAAKRERERERKAKEEEEAKKNALAAKREQERKAKEKEASRQLAAKRERERKAKEEETNRQLAAKRERERKAKEKAEAQRVEKARLVAQPKESGNAISKAVVRPNVVGQGGSGSDPAVVAAKTKGIGAGKPGVVDMGAYRATVQKMIRNRWSVPRGIVVEKHPEVVVRINRAGRVVYSRNNRKSGIAELDRSAINAVRIGSRLIPLPAGYDKDVYEVTVKFQVD